MRKLTEEQKLAAKEKRKEYLREYSLKNSKKYYLENKNAVLARVKKYRAKNQDKIKEEKKVYREANKDKINSYQKEYNKLHRNDYREANKDKIKIYQKEYHKEYRKNNKDKRNNRERERNQNDPLYKLSNNIRASIRTAFKRNGYKKTSRTYLILGCNFEEFKIHLESKFEPWMNWNNYGLYNGELNYGWDIDHIIPSSKALSDDDMINLNHYTNLQPLCSYYNRDIKRNKI